jgi:hypothetical protein
MGAVSFGYQAQGTQRGMAKCDEPARP